MDQQEFLKLLGTAQAGDLKAAQQLQEFEKSDIVNYYSLLCQTLADQNIPANTRTLAMANLSNTVSARSAQQTKLLQGRWISQDATMRSSIRSLLLAQLDSPIQPIRLTAIKTISSIAIAEIPLGQWPEVIPQLTDAAKNAQVSLLVRLSSITIVGQICAQLTHECTQLKQHTHCILNCIATTVGDANIELRIAGIKALEESLKFCSTNFEKDSERRLLMQMMCQAATPTTPDPKIFEKQFELQAAAWDCLITVVGLYYDSLESFIIEIFNCSVATIQQSLQKFEDEELKAATELASIQAIEFWISVAKNEDAIQGEIDEAEYANETTEYKNLRYTQHALNQVVPLLLQCMCLQSEDVEDDNYNITLSALNCLTEFASQCDISIFAIVIPQVQSSIQSPDWRFRDAACTALGCLLSSHHVESQEVSATLSQALSIVTDLVNDQAAHVSVSAAWCLSQFARFLPSVVIQNLQFIYERAILPSLQQPRTRTTINICRAIHELCDNLFQDNEEETEDDVLSAAQKAQTNALAPIFEPLVQHLLAISDATKDATLLINSYEALASLISSGAGNNNPSLQSLLQVLGQRLQTSIQQFSAAAATTQSGDDIASYKTHTQGLLCGSLSVLIRQLPREFVLSNSLNLLNVFASVLNTDPSVSVEALTGIESIVYALGQDFEQHAAGVYTQLIPLIQQQLQAGAVVSRAFVVMSTVLNLTKVCTQDMADSIIQLIFLVLSTDAADQQGKVSAVDCVGDIASLLGDRFIRYYQPVNAALSRVYTYSITKNHPILDADLADYLLSLQISVATAYDAIILALSRENAPQENYTELASSVQEIIMTSVYVLQDTEAIPATRSAALLLLTDIFDALPDISSSVTLQVVKSEIPSVLRSVSTTTRGKVRKLSLAALQSLSHMKQ